jgi:hypothetical protein
VSKDPLGILMYSSLGDMSYDLEMCSTHFSGKHVHQWLPNCSQEVQQALHKDFQICGILVLVLQNFLVTDMCCYEKYEVISLCNILN